MIAVEGNIASGKSTFLGLLAERSEVAASYKFTFYMLSKRSVLSILYIYLHIPQVAIFPEPVDRWTNVGGQNLFRSM